MALPLVPLLVGAGLGAAGNFFSARQANKFSERMSSTAHQREVKDLRRAGLNPMLSANRGASAPQGVPPDPTGGAEKGASTALNIQQTRAQVELLSAQAESARATASYTRAQQGDLMSMAASGRYDIIAQQVRNQTLDADAKERLLPVVLERAKEEIAMTVSTARRAKAAAMLDELARTGAFNSETFEATVGELGPWVRLMMELAKLRRRQ